MGRKRRRKRRNYVLLRRGNKANCKTEKATKAVMKLW